MTDEWSELEELAKIATPEPWVTDGGAKGAVVADCGADAFLRGWRVHACGDTELSYPAHDAAFIAAARAAVPELIKRVRELERFAEDAAAAINETSTKKTEKQ